MQSSPTESYYLDHRVIFIAACSSFITLLMLSIFDKCYYIKTVDRQCTENNQSSNDHHRDQKNIESTIYDDNSQQHNNIEPLSQSKLLFFQNN